MSCGAELEVANTILKQLGGPTFKAMTGAKDFVGSKDGYLLFRLPPSNKGINKCRITLQSNDLYKLEFFKVRGIDWHLIDTRDDVYCDQLQNVFTTVTGRFTRL
jgi:hypothetical protein